MHDTKQIVKDRSMRRLRFRLLIAAVSLGAVALVTGCGDSDSSDALPSSTVRLTMQDIAYDSSAFTATMGEQVRIDLENRGQMTHDFTIESMPMKGLHMMGGASGAEHMHQTDQYAMHLALERGAKGQLEFEPTQPGTYEFFCTVPGHREAGMRGMLTVR